MGLLQRLAQQPKALELYSSTAYETLFGSAGETDSGAYVNELSAMQLSTVFACVRVIAESIAQLPLHLYTRLPGGGKERVTDHPVARLINIQPNPWQDAFEFKESMASALALHGNAFALMTVVREEVRELLPISAGAVTVAQDPRTYELRYTLRTGGDTFEVPQSRMLHIRGISLDGITGCSPIRIQREAIGIAMQQNKQAARLLKTGAQLSGILEHPATLSTEAAQRIRDSWEETYAGAGNAFKTVLLEEGMKFNKTGMTAEDAQFLESRKFQQNEIASIFRVPPHLINNFDRQTWNNIEQAGLDFVTYSLGPHLTRFEQRIGRCLLKPDERDRLYLKFIVDALLKGDTKTRFDAYAVAKTNGWLSANEIRAYEDLNPVEGGDVYAQPTAPPTEPVLPRPSADDPAALKAWILELKDAHTERQQAHEQQTAQHLARVDRALDVARDQPAPQVHTHIMPIVDQPPPEAPHVTVEAPTVIVEAATPVPTAKPVAFEITYPDGRKTTVVPVFE